MRMGRDGKMRPNAPPAELEDQSNELVLSTDSGLIEHVSAIMSLTL
jgi:hypothetical protein